MADKYWKGGGTNNNWNSSPTTNWANSDGGPGNQTAPSAGDRVFFTANSGTGAAVWNVSISLTMLDCSGSRNQITHNNSITMTLSAGNFILPDGAGATYTVGGTGSVTTFTGTTGTQQLKSNGKLLPNMSQTGAGGTVQLQDDCDASTNQGNGYTFTNGTLDLQTHTLTCSVFVSNVTNTRTITGSGDINVNNTQESSINIVAINGTGLTVTGFTGAINCSGTFTGTRIHTITLPGGAITWPGGISFAANASGGVYSISASTTFAALTMTGPCTLVQTSGTTLTISGGGSAVAINGSQGNEVFLSSSNYSVAATLSAASGTMAATWAAIRAMAFSGGATFTASNSVDLGYNTGITITTPQLGVSRSRLQAGI